MSRRRRSVGQHPTREPALGAPAARQWPAIVLLALLCGALYGRVIGFGFTRTDDTVQLVDNARFVGDLGNLPAAFSQPFFAAKGAANYYRPVVTVTYMLDAQWTDARPLGYHLTNLVLHLVAAWLLFALARRLGFGVDLSLGAAAVLVVHPVLTEAVAWVPGRGDSLLAVWLLAAILSLMRWLETGDRLALFGHAAVVIAALFTKEAAVALPMALAAFVLLVARKPSALERPHLWLAWGIPLVAWFVCRRAALAASGDQGAGAQVAELVRHLPVLLMFLGKAVWPSDLAVLAIERDTPWLAGALALVPIALAFFWLAGRRRRVFAWGVSTFVLLLTPSLAVSDFLILEIRSYAPLVGLLVAALAVAQQLRDRWSSPRAVWIQRGVGAAVIALLAFRAFGYAESFKDAEAFTRQAVASSPHSGLAHLNRGIALQMEHRLEEAEAEYTTSLELDARLAVTHNNLGLVELHRGRPDLAERLFREELAVNPSYDKAHLNLALALKALGRFEDAAASLHQAVDINPRNTDALEGLASYYAFRGDAVMADAFAARLRMVRSEDRAAR